jgi:hypothetical protein
VKGEILSCAGAGTEVKKKKSNWLSATTLGIQGWVIKVNGDQQ